MEGLGPKEVECPRPDSEWAKAGPNNQGGAGDGLD